MRILVTVPSPYLIRSKRLSQHEAWCLASAHHQVTLVHEPTPNRIDWSLWACIDLAKQRRPHYWVRLDEDAIPEAPLDNMVVYAEENRRVLGCAVSGTTILQRTGQVVVGRFPEDFEKSMPNDRPFPVKWVGGSLVFTHMSVLTKMEPISFYEDPRWPEKKAIYWNSTSASTDDSDFSSRATELGFKIAADPRLLCHHMTDDYPIPSYRPPMSLDRPLTLDTAGLGIEVGVPN